MNKQGGTGFVPPNQLIRANLIDCLKKVWDKAGILTILKPFALSEKEELVKAVPQWKEDISSLKLPENKINTALELMLYAALQRFPRLTTKEIHKMLELTPLEETVASQELIRIGMEKGMDQGELIGEIRMAQRILKHPVSSKDALAQKNVEELKEMFQQIEAEFASAPLVLISKLWKGELNKGYSNDLIVDKVEIIRSPMSALTMKECFRQEVRYKF